MDEPLWRYGAADLAAAIAKGTFGARDVVEAFLDRIAEQNPAVNAITVVLAEEARAAADESDRIRRDGGVLGALHGVPFTVKENVDVEGTATTRGVAALATAVATVDAPQPGRFRAAGGIPIGRTNLPDFGLRWHTDNALHGATMNPWDPARTPGGSSGGEAAALAVGMSPLGIGNDLGGSVRIPSHCCGTAALKPTVGRIPHARSLPPLDDMLAIQLMGVQGPMARHVRDLRLAFRVAAGQDPRDPKSVPAPLDGPAVEHPIRVAVVADPGGLGVDAGIADGVRLAADALADGGYHVQELQPPRVEDAAMAWRHTVMADVARMRPLMEPYLSHDARQVLDLSIAAVDTSPDVVAWTYVTRHGCAREWSVFLDDWPLVLGPTMTAPPFPVGRDLDGADAGEEIFAGMRLVLAVNLLGLPAVALPAGTADGLPCSVQVIGPRFREDLCLDAAEAIEDRVGTITPIDAVT